MTSHRFSYPKVVAVKATSPHRPTKAHGVVPRPATDKTAAERPRRER